MRICCCFKEQRYKINASNSQPFVCCSVVSVCCFKEQRYKINASNSQPLRRNALQRPELFQRAKIQDKCKQFTTGKQPTYNPQSCFKEQRYKINASNSQRMALLTSNITRCFKEQRYKINASNSQQYPIVGNIDYKLFQRAKIQDKCKQFTTRFSW